MIKRLWWWVTRTETVTTIYGRRPVEGLEKRTGTEGQVSWVEYWLKDVLVHRSVHIELTGQEYNIFQQNLGG